MGRFASSVLAFVALSPLFHVVQAHMEMITPYPLRSKYNPANTNPDYSNTSPMMGDGSNYPCKGYHKDAGLTAVASYTAGQTYQLSLSGSASHGGGSCQLSLSYDNGASFIVIKSMIGGCPLTLNYPFTIPQNAPSGQALFAWTWFNKIGNREMYMNCAVVNIVGASASSNIAGPQIFIANLGNGLGTCGTVEGDEVVFPKPGNDVTYGGMWAGTTPSQSSYLSSCTYKGENQDSGSYSGGGGGSSSSSSAKSTSTSTTTLYTTVQVTYSTHRTIVSSTYTTFTTNVRTSSMSSATVAPISSVGGQKGVDSNTSTSSSQISTKPTTTSTTTAYVPTTSKVVISTTTVKVTSTASQKPSTTTVTTGPTGSACAQGTILCDSFGDSWSLCADGKYVYMGKVANGTVCLGGQIQRRSDAGACSAVDQIMCSSDGQSWFMCSQKAWVNMGAVAPGTKCVRGQFVVS